MSEEQTLYVRLIDGVDCFAPVAARRNPDGTFRLSANSEFDPADTSTLFEFLPGDVVRAEIRAPFAGQAPVTIATQLVSSPVQDRDYWLVLFRLACGAAEPPALGAVRLERVAVRVRSEIESGARWHYPSVVEWAMKCGGHASGA